MNDDLESAEAGLNEGNSSYHTVSEHWDLDSPPLPPLALRL